MAAGGVQVRGLRELQRDLKLMAGEVGKELRDELQRVAVPVRVLAENKAGAAIENIGPRWGRMRIGVNPGLVYVAPASHRQGGSPRPNLGFLLMDKAMQPALDESEEGIVLRVDQMLDNLAGFNGF